MSDIGKLWDAAMDRCHPWERVVISAVAGQSDVTISVWTPMLDAVNMMAPVFTTTMPTIDDAMESLVQYLKFRTS